MERWGVRRDVWKGEENRARSVRRRKGCRHAVRLAGKPLKS
ncbi:hypothetical protein FH063_002883 [Azospirillum argentinense]|uniref:Uncharacterized protein n=1 Tax=Azospirillum argentinense TaxID=2970906 RepID=A0A5B0KNX7_9PROT|nr:hypothetical protein FH063_002883 [Azospirillum argentinense]